MALKIYAHGNCQTYFMHKIVSEKDRDFEFSFGEVHKIDLAREMAAYEDKIRSSDVIFSQNISPSYRAEPRFSLEWIIENKKPGSVIIKIPNIYFLGYHPQHIQMWNIPPFAPLDYGDVHIAKLYSDGFSSAEIYRAINDPDFFDPFFVNTHAFDSIQELRRREVEVDADVIATDLILAEWKEYRLFHVPNHPTRRLMCKFVNRVFDRIGIPINSPISERDYFESPRQIIYPSTARGLQLKFDFHLETTELNTNEGRMPFEKYVIDLIDNWDRAGGREVIAKNLYLNPAVELYLTKFASVKSMRSIDRG